MKPQTLTLSNYRAFVSADIPLDLVDAAAIVGPNGAGKSSVCEAILWSLYGDGRSSGVDGVVALGSDEAAVELTYAHNGNTYRVIRKRSRGKRSDLQYLVEDCGEWKPLSGATIAETQAKISRDLAMDKTLFLASSFVMQGDSAGICTAQPRDRKEVLMSILEDRLGKFGPLHEAAKATVKGLDDASALTRAKRSNLEATVADREHITASRDTSENRLAVLRTDLEAKEKRLEELRAAQARSQADRDRLVGIERQLSDLTREIASLGAEVEKQEGILYGAAQLLSQAEDIKAKCSEAATLEAEIDLKNQVKEQYTELGRQYAEAKAAIERQTAEIEGRRQSKQREIDREGERLRAERDQIETRIDGQKRRIAETGNTALLLEEVPCKDSPMADACKLLENARIAGAALPSMESELADLHAGIDAVDESMKANAARYEELKSIDMELAEAAKRTGEADALRVKARELNHDPIALQVLTARYNTAKQARDMLAELSAAEARTTAAEAAMGLARESMAAKQAQMPELTTQRDAAKKALANADDATFEITVTDREVSSLKRDIDEETRVSASLQTKLDDIAQAEETLNGINALLAETDRKRLVYATLMDAFSRNGIPALVIDAAIPTIEEFANDILASLSDGRMSLKMVTQKLTGSGIAETLDIIVSDAAGERLYEDFSGGEKLRIDLAVRIALGRLLATRNGAKIELLILDEVCAPLDEAGEEALVDCIQRLRSTFGCILLITHRDSLRDRLPQQIIVTKNGRGSEARLVA